MNQDLSIINLLLHASFVVQLVVLLLVIVSIASWAAIIRKYFALRRMRALNDDFEREFWSGTSLNELYELMRGMLEARYPHLAGYQPHYTDFRMGDVRHSQADISKAARLLGYQPSHRLEDGLRDSLEWYMSHLQAPA